MRSMEDSRFRYDLFHRLTPIYDSDDDDAIEAERLEELYPEPQNRPLVLTHVPFLQSLQAYHLILNEDFDFREKSPDLLNMFDADAITSMIETGTLSAADFDWATYSTEVLEDANMLMSTECR